MKVIPDVRGGSMAHPGGLNFTPVVDAPVSQCREAPARKGGRNISPDFVFLSRSKITGLW